MSKDMVYLTKPKASKDFGCKHPFGYMIIQKNMFKCSRSTFRAVSMLKECNSKNYVINNFVDSIKYYFTIVFFLLINLLKKGYDSDF